jgi:hypothetical protein
VLLLLVLLLQSGAGAVTLGLQGHHFAIPFGANGDMPVPGDYNGDGNTDIAVLRPMEGNWCIPGYPIIAWAASKDIPVAADYNGKRYNRRRCVSTFVRPMACQRKRRTCDLGWER